LKPYGKWMSQIESDILKPDSNDGRKADFVHLLIVFLHFFRSAQAVLYIQQIPVHPFLPRNAKVKKTLDDHRVIIASLPGPVPMYFTLIPTNSSINSTYARASLATSSWSQHCSKQDLGIFYCLRTPETLRKEPHLFE
jgi:hypothetical protein